MLDTRLSELGGTGSVLGLRLVLEHAADCGVDVPALMTALDIESTGLEDSDHRVPLRVLRGAWDLAATRSHDPSFGLHVAERATIGAFEALDYAMWASATLEEVLDRIIRFHRVIGDDLELELVHSGKWVRLRRVVGHDRRHRAESVLALIVTRARELCGRSFRLHEARFMHHKPADVRPHRALFRCPVRFGCATAELVFAKQLLQLPVRTTKPILAAVLDRHLRDLLGRLPRGQTILQRVSDAVARTLHVGRPSLAGTARALHASPRTLQRHLHEAGVTHRQIVDDVRREMAEHLLATRRVSMSELAFLLGFEHASGFRRAHRRWTRRNASRAAKN
jgi:AraC-like DNA-binding protein